MKLRITIDMFSGRENPVLVLDEAESKQALRRLKPKEAMPRGAPKAPPTILGYRGLILEQVQGRNRKFPERIRLTDGVLYGGELHHRAADPTFEDFVCGTPGPPVRIGLEKDAIRMLDRERLKAKVIRESYPWERVIWPRPKKCPCAPLYEPAWWNDGGQKQYNNNCYNYSTNYRTDTFAQPGRAAGAQYTSLLCSSVRPAAIADDLIDMPRANNKCPKEGHLVALVVGPNYDYHWYRKGRNGLWTHKPGGTKVTNLDNAGVLIKDPRTADRGPYTKFCTFMVVMHGHIKIK